MNSYYLGIVLVFLSAIGFGVMPIFAIYAYAEGIDVITLLFLRFSLAAIIFFAYSRRLLITIRLTKKNMLSFFILGGILYTAQSFSYFSSVKYIPASLTALILYTYPIFVAILALLIEKEPLGRQTIISIGLSLLGLTLVLGTTTELNTLGIAFAFLAAIVYSLYITIGNRVVQKTPPLITSAFVALFAALSFFLIGNLTNSLNFSLSFITWLSILGIVLFSTVLAMFTFFKGLELIGSTRAAILSMLEPLVTIFFMAILFSEHLTLVQLFGALLVLSGAILVILTRQPTHTLEPQ